MALQDGEKVGLGSRRGVALGFLAMAPLLLSYEVGLGMAGAGGARNTAELLLGRALVVFGGAETHARWVGLVALAALAFVRLRLVGARIARSLLLVFLEGALAAAVLGPMLLLASAAFDVTALDLRLPAEPADHPPGLAVAGRLLGAGAWEEILFRLGLYSLVFLLARRLADFLGAGQAPARLVGDAAALVGSSLAFAAFHLAGFTGLFGLGGEPFDGPVFLWRTLAGCLLALLFRWRGPGVAAWAHGLFNLALVLGSGPGVFR